MVLDKGLLTMGILWVGTARKYDKSASAEEA
jgi:hypothetical protein